MLQNANPTLNHEYYNNGPIYGKFVNFGNAVFFRSVGGKLYTICSSGNADFFNSMRYLGKLFVVNTH